MYPCVATVKFTWWWWEATNFDLVVKAERLPKEGESMMVKDLQFFPGGKGANQAVAAARMGAKAILSELRRAGHHRRFPDS